MKKKNKTACANVCTNTNTRNCLSHIYIWVVREDNWSAPKVRLKLGSSTASVPQIDEFVLTKWLWFSLSVSLAAVLIETVSWGRESLGLQIKHILTADSVSLVNFFLISECNRCLVPCLSFTFKYNQQPKNTAEAFLKKIFLNLKYFYSTLLSLNPNFPSH